MGDFIFIYVTAPSEEEAKKVAKHLLERRLVACANIFPISSLYWWEGRIQDEKEFVLILKTKELNYEKVKEEIETIHSYSIPCITKISVGPNEKYAEWLKNQIK